MLADNKVLNFVDSLFNEARLNDELPAVRTPQEGYGIMAERFLSVASCTAGAKKAVADALEVMYEGQSATITPLESLAHNDDNDEPDNEEE